MAPKGTIGGRINQPKLGSPGPEKIRRSTAAGSKAKPPSLSVASMSAMGSDGAQSSLIRILGAADPSVAQQSGWGRGKIATWLTKIAETVDSAGLLRADKKSWAEVKCVADDPEGGG